MLRSVHTMSVPAQGSAMAAANALGGTSGWQVPAPFVYQPQAPAPATVQHSHFAMAAGTAHPASTDAPRNDLAALVLFLFRLRCSCIADQFCVVLNSADPPVCWLVAYVGSLNSRTRCVSVVALHFALPLRVSGCILPSCCVSVVALVAFCPPVVCAYMCLCRSSTVVCACMCLCRSSKRLAFQMPGTALLLQLQLLLLLLHLPLDTICPLTRSAP